jgi:DNA-directed RNA polymerase subunit K/omega
VMDRSRTNTFEFVVIAGARAKQLMRGCTPRTTLRPAQGLAEQGRGATGNDKIIKIAQREVREGKVEKVIARTD